MGRNRVTSQTTAEYARDPKALAPPRPVIHKGDAMDWYDVWPSPTVIISDGPYGLGSYPGDPPTHEGLAEWYKPHAKKWAERASAQTTLWFWNSEIGWVKKQQQ